VALLQRWFPQRPIVAVTHDLKAQESFHQDLQTWLGQAKGEGRIEKGEGSPTGPVTSSPPLFYPAWEVLPHQGQLPHADVISERLETLAALAEYREAGTSSPPKAASEAVPRPRRPVQRVPPRSWLRRRLPCSSGPSRLTGCAHTAANCAAATVEPLDLIEWLEDQAYEPKRK